MTSSLQKQWEETLKEEGLGVINTTLSQNPPKTRRSYHSIRAYFASVDEILRSYAFKSHIDKLIWECHAQGMTKKATMEKLQVSSHKVVLALRRVRVANGLPAKLTNKPVRITERDKSILALKNQGLTYAQIAKTLFLSSEKVVYDSLKKQNSLSGKVGRRPKPRD